MADNQIFWPNYLFFCDFTDEKDTLATLPVGVISQATATTLAAALSSHDQGVGRSLWVDQANPEWGLLGAQIIHNGPNETGFLSNGLYDAVLMIQFPSTQVAPQGVISLHYNARNSTAPAKETGV